MLMHHSPAVVEAVLAMAGQVGLMRAKLVADAKDRIRQILELLDEFSAA